MDAKQALQKAKISLLTTSVFYATILLGLRQEITSRISTAAVDGRTLFVNPDFLLDLTTEEATGLLAHEVSHLALNHLTRKGDRSHSRYNCAADHVINLMLLDQSFQLPANGLWDDQYKGLSTEKVYDLLPEDPKFPEELLDCIEPASDAVASNIKELLIQASTQARLAGEHLPDAISRAIKELIEPKINWTIVLQNYLQEYCKNDYTWTRPNRRYPDFYLPSAHSPTIRSVVVAVDTSGSVSDKEVQAYLSEIEYIRQLFQIEKLTIIATDTIVRNVIEVSPQDNLLDLKLEGGGGTGFQPVFRLLESMQPTVLLFFTDMCFRFDFPEPSFDCIWINTYDNTKAKTGFGKTIFIN